MDGAAPTGEHRRSQNTRVRIPFGRADHATDRFHEVRWTLGTRGGGPVDVVFRCYDDAIALRYELPAPGGKGAPVVIADESTSFHVDGDPTAYVQYLANYNTSHEHPVETLPLHAVASEKLLDLPLTLSRADGTWMAITEASLRRYAGMALMRTRPPGGAPAGSTLSATSTAAHGRCRACAPPGAPPPPGSR